MHMCGLGNFDAICFDNLTSNFPGKLDFSSLLVLACSFLVRNRNHSIFFRISVYR